VLVHDAARPCLFSQDLECLLERVGSHPIGGLLAVPAADTLKRVSAGMASAGMASSGMASSGMAIEQTVDRAGLWRALTPQMFRYRRLCEALDSAVAAGRLPTDEAQALEWLGERPILVEGSAANIKITSADDLLVAAALLGARADSLAPGQGSPQ
jgi:2-C-methyl-D-erythritol 4-phosphate cytidylyltransferase